MTNSQQPPYCYNAAVSPKFLVFAVLMLATCVCPAQESPSKQPPVKVNVLNVCTPSADERIEIASALAGIPKKPSFSADFEVDRGRSILDPSANPLAMASGGTTVPADMSAAA